MITIVQRQYTAHHFIMKNNERIVRIRNIIRIKHRTAENIL